ncbi:ureidoglycolate hydrolase [Nannizzia gypsea CBS 118893]|uniref:Ureidoglycolate hydrolase n=1 Tax=Arthroderma gypseum (strain ATCC MYA-4604 / CBS 118893) TaxID=535722 RepID=E4UYE1_ARTGP|nr:ureidoglycolate hydrolase [Nannizzia gypsea CBS 118893]EFR02104.1 ureidoglycolate hydrolase [Nannizzia gypsea CBS 118893]
MAPALLFTPTVRVPASPLTPKSFKPFGTAIEAPLPETLNAPPSSIAGFKAPDCTAESANQGSAVKWSPISPITDSYGTSSKQGEARMSMFSCFPRELRAPLSLFPSSSSKGFSGLWNQNLSGLFDVKFLERHPYTSQSFIPLSRSLNRDHAGRRDSMTEDVFYLVIVAPSLVGQVDSATSIRDPPDLNNIQAFIAKPGQAVTYAAGSWHAPMVVIGRQRIDFVVVQYVNGIDRDDCELIGLEDGIVVEADARSSRVVAKL